MAKNAWREHVKAVMRTHPKWSLKESLKYASKTYHKKKK